MEVATEEGKDGPNRLKEIVILKKLLSVLVCDN